MKDLSVAESYAAPVYAPAFHGGAYGAFGQPNPSYGGYGQPNPSYGGYGLPYAGYGVYEQDDTGYGAHKQFLAGYGKKKQEHHGDQGLHAAKTPTHVYLHAAKTHTPKVSASHSKDYSSYKKMDGGYSAKGLDYYHELSLNADRARAAQEKHDIAAKRAYDADKAESSKNGKYKKENAYDHNHGSGYEKAYSYGKNTGHENIGADYDEKHSQHGVHDKIAHQKSGAHARGSHDRFSFFDPTSISAYDQRAGTSSSSGMSGSSGGMMTTG